MTVLYVPYSLDSGREREREREGEREGKRERERDRGDFIELAKKPA